MGKRHPNLPAWQWRAYPHNHQHPTNLVLHLIAVPLFIVAFLLMVSGVFSLDLASVAIGVIGLLAALGLQRHGHSLEAQASEPFSDRKDAVSRLLVEQFLTFPRFFFSGGWWRAWRERHRRHR
ncbi:MULTISPECIES: terminase [unclassified Pseudomonas]|uniref:terminase n=1 Tax=unclassified Pseudomonas TaxID=196821 RepID=UPI00215E3143|nr:MULTISPECIES: terminase [unclassified Pseudomonas]UVM52228.1 terminase [Pseudomonas sp. B21-015]WPN59691.1 terminase [Pseudomonas sp. P9_31]